MAPYNPLVSVIIPSYNRPKMLREAIESVLNQTVERLEIIIIDDGSTQPLESIVNKIDDDRIKYHRFEENKGANVARNWGIRHASGEHIAFLDDDDRWAPTKLKKQLAAFNEDPSIGLVYTGQRFVDQNNHTLETKKPTTSGNITRHLLKGGYLGGYSCVMVKKELIEETGKPDPELPILQDRDWWLQLSSVTRVKSISEPLVIRQFGEYAQIGDLHEELRDIAYPRIYGKHKGLARDEGLRFQFYFKGRFLESIGRSALATGRYSEARRYLFYSLVYHPWSRGAFIRFFVSLGGQHLYKISKGLRDKIRKILK